MPTYLHTIETWNPSFVQPQTQACEHMQAQFSDKKTQRVLRHVYKQSEIDQRYTCVPFSDAPQDPLFGSEAGSPWRNPGTGERNRVYREVAQTASVDLARKTVEASPFNASQITHVITVSCTGFYNPGPDFHIIKSLGLSASVQRYHLGFMGCYAAFPAMRLADSICQNHPDAVVMIQCMELCSLHVQLDPENLEAMIASSLFGDGAACAIFSGQAPATGITAYRVDHLASTLTPDGEDAMAWEIGDHGFEIVLSGYVPHILGENIRDAVFPFLETTAHRPKEIETWAVHPGGKAILDRVGEALDLPANALDLSRDVLRRFGNMSSATVLFLIAEALASHPKGPCAAMAFGPGLTVEMGLLHPVQGPCP
ncbi:3-oxoacyl-[acyl-carrier-protein] synthase III C-terminal domain-containing protein [Kiritimatiellota bacterium B12222]|nr:3-oxoacyl-[acyl-carrier-protein] synthase III C-terminal domain-containing protein [Kiritimatiellota bacterium B12222]